MLRPDPRLVEILEKIPVVKARDTIYAAHHNLVKEFLVKWMEINRFDDAETAIYKRISNMVERVDGEPILPDDWNSILGVLHDVDGLITKYYEELIPLAAPYRATYIDDFRKALSKLLNVRSGELIRAEQYNIRRDSLEALSYLYRIPVGSIFLFEGNDWPVAKDWIINGSIVIFSAHGYPPLTPEELLSYMQNYAIVVVKEMDTGPFHGEPIPYLENILYTVTIPTQCYADLNTIVEQFFRENLGFDKAFADHDYMVPDAQKVDSAVKWAKYNDTCGWSYVWVGNSAVIELPYDGYTYTIDYFERYMMTISGFFFNQPWPTRILYLGHYASEMRDPLDSYIYEMERRRPIKVVDARGDP
ncbi:MAG: hypothetical protein QXH97_00190 [Candidatus Bathyarchaeia archaeon]